MLLYGRSGRLHLDLSLEERAFGDPHSRRENIALDLRGGADAHRFSGIQIALDLAVDDDDARTDIAFHGTIGPHRQALCVRDRTFHAALNDEIFLRRQFAAKSQSGAEYGRTRRRVGQARFGRPRFRRSRFSRPRLRRTGFDSGLGARFARFGARRGGLGRSRTAA